MSVYSGFATRHEESFYNKLLEKLVTILIQKIIEISPPLLSILLNIYILRTRRREISEIYKKNSFNNVFSGEAQIFGPQIFLNNR